MLNDPPAPMSSLPPEEQQWRTVIDTLPVLAWTAGPDGSVDFLNKPWLEYTGLAEAAALSWAWLEAMHPDDRSRVSEYWRAVVESKSPAEVELRLRRHDGAYRWFLIRARPLLSHSGEVVKWYGTNTEIEERRQLEQALLAREQQSRAFVDKVPGLLFTTTPAGEVEYVNRRLLDYFGRSLDELREWRVSDSVHPDDLEKTVREVTNGIVGEQPYAFEQRLRRADGAYRWFQFSAVPDRDADGRIVRWYGLLTDTTELVAASEELQHIQGKLARATHLATLSELAASVAHEINQPLAAVVANAHACLRWLSSDSPNVARATMSAEKIIRDGNAAAVIVQRIRSLFQKAPLLKEPVKLSEAIGEVLRLQAPDLRAKDIALVMNVAEDLPVVAADRVQIQQVLVNLVRNAVEALEPVRGRVKFLTVCARREPSQVCVEVSDNGVGLEDAESAFEPFFSTKDTGLGMGLSICRSVVRAHGGLIWLRPNLPNGATAGFALPLD